MVLARLVSPLLSFLIIVLVARVWGQEMFGKFNTVWVWLILFRSLSIFGIGEFISKHVGANRDNVSEYRTHGLLFGSFSSLVCSAFMIGGAFLLDYSDDVKYGIIIASMALPCYAFIVISHAILTAFQKTRTVGIAWTLENILFLCLGSIVIIKGYGFINLFWCLVLSRLSAAILNLIIVYKSIGPVDLQIDLDFFRKMLPELAIFGVSSLAYFIFLRIDVVMLSKMTDMVSVGLYSSASNLMEVCILLPVIFYFINLPVMARGYKSSKEQIHRKIESDAAQLFVLVFLAFGFGFFFAEVIIPLIYGKSFVGASWILKLLMIAFLIQSADGILAMSCLAAGYHKLVMYIVVIRAAINIVLNLVFIPVFGAVGAALATVLSISFSFAALQIFMKRNIGSFRWIRIIGKPALSCLLIILLIFPLMDYLNTILVCSIFLLGYVFVLFVLNGFSTATA